MLWSKSYQFDNGEEQEALPLLRESCGFDQGNNNQSENLINIHGITKHVVFSFEYCLSVITDLGHVTLWAKSGPGCKSYLSNWQANEDHAF